MSSYYAENLAGRRLQRCYEVASPRVRQYLEAEIQQVVSLVRPRDAVLELGCGYGRVALRLAETVGSVVGIDTAVESLALARELDRGHKCEFMQMDATDLAFGADRFDAVVCVQNGICAFGVDQAVLMSESLRVARPGGLVLFSTYSDRFWQDRLAWFDAQASAGLIGAVDRAQSRDGVIVLEDGFRAGRVTPEGFKALCSCLGREGRITEVDESSVFCELVK
ncbi:MAG TPA: class I SAM-dependent methyltransferase [bacterium]|nr:class I SAM-dependent methyltransferase [bacterium]